MRVSRIVSPTMLKEPKGYLHLPAQATVKIQKNQRHARACLHRVHREAPYRVVVIPAPSSTDTVAWGSDGGEKSTTRRGKKKSLKGSPAGGAGFSKGGGEVLLVQDFARRPVKRN